MELSTNPLQVRHRRWLALLTTLALTVALLAVGSSRAAADGPTSFGNATAIAIPAAGSADQMGPAAPYPSDIAVSGLAGALTKVTVTFSGLTHSAVNDIDAMVVAPTGQRLVVLSDVGDPNTLAFANNATLTFDDAAGGPVPAGNIPTGTYKPTNNGGGDTFPAPAPAPTTDTTLAGAFTGINPNGTWHLYVVDDTSGDIGNMAGGWSLSVTTEVAASPTTTTVTTSDATSTTGDPVTFTAAVKAGATAVTTGTVQFTDDGSVLGSPVALNASGQASLTTSALTEGTHEIRATYGGATGFLTSNGTVSQRVDNATVVTGTTFCNPGPITPPALGAAQPYPSHVTVSGLSGTVSKVTAALKGVSHQAPIDFDVMLSGPTPSKNLILLSDAGGQNPVSNLDLTFDDAATGPVPTPMVSGTFKPTNADDGSADTFPAPAPAPTSATALSTFAGAGGNGQWSLWVVDDASGDSGTIANGWCLTVTSLTPTTTVLTAAPNPSAYGATVTLTATVQAGGQPVTSGSVQFSDGATPLGGPVTVGSDGTATLTTSALGVGVHGLTAAYGGTDTLGASTGSVDQVVTKAATATALASDVNPSTVGAPVTFTATVTSGGVPVTTGTVQFSDGATALGAPVAVAADGTATYSTSALASGSHAIAAAYQGTATLAASTGTLTQDVDLQTTATTLTAAPDPSDAGEAVTFTATVTSGGAPVTSGTVQLSDGAAALGSPVPVAADGTATFTTSALAPGEHTVKAAYSGSASYAPSDATVTQGVRPVADAGGPYAAAEGSGVTLDASGSTPGATYAWDLDGDGDFTDATGASPTLTWAQLEALGIDDGPSDHDVTVRVSLGSLASTATTTLHVGNTAPVTVVTGDLTATVGTPFTVKVGADDPSSADLAAQFTYTVDWGDGSPVETLTGPADPPVTHTYATAGTFSASMTATDKDGGTGGPTTVQVQAVAAGPTTSTTTTGSSSPTGPESSSSSSGSGLAYTGADVAGPLGLVLLLLCSGGLLVLVSRRRLGTGGRHR